MTKIKTTTTSTTIVTNFNAQREALTARLTALYKDGRRVDDEKSRLDERKTQIDEEKRLIEDALAAGTSTSATTSDSPRTVRTTARAARASTGKIKGGKPGGVIMPAIWDYLVKHPGSKSGDIRKNIRIEGKSLLKMAGSEEKAKMSCGTALNAMKKKGRLTVKGHRSDYRYFVNNVRA